MHRAFVFAQRLLFHRNDPRNSFIIDGDLQIDGDGAVDPFAASGVLDVVGVLEARRVIAIRRFLAQPHVAADRRAPRRPARVVGLDVLADGLVRFPAFFKDVDIRGVERNGEIDVVRLVARNEVVNEIVDPDLPGSDRIPSVDRPRCAD